MLMRTTMLLNADSLYSAFLRDASQGNLDEVKYCQLGQSPARQDVKVFGNHMVEDHGKMNGEVAALAKFKGVDLPKDLSMMQTASQKDARHEKRL